MIEQIKKRYVIYTLSLSWISYKVLSQYVTTFEIRVNLAELMVLTDAFKLSIDVQLGAIELVTDTNLKVLSAPHGETKLWTVYIHELV